MTTLPLGTCWVSGCLSAAGDLFSVSCSIASFLTGGPHTAALGVRRHPPKAGAGVFGLLPPASAARSRDCLALYVISFDRAFVCVACPCCSCCWITSDASQIVRIQSVLQCPLFLLLLFCCLGLLLRMLRCLRVRVGSFLG
jgi:hypothetical protein